MSMKLYDPKYLEAGRRRVTLTQAATCEVTRRVVLRGGPFHGEYRTFTGEPGEKFYVWQYSRRLSDHLWCRCVVYQILPCGEVADFLVGYRSPWFRWSK